MTTFSKIAEPLIHWLFEDRSLDEIKAEMALTRSYVRGLQEQVRKIKKKKKFTGKVSAKGLLTKNNPELSRKISLAEYQLGMSLQALLTPTNFAFFADKLPIQTNPADPELIKRHDIEASHHALVLDLDTLEPLWRAARRQITKYIRDYATMMEMGMEIPKTSTELAEALRSLSSEVIKLYTEADPHAADAISRQAHRKLLDFQSANVAGMQEIDPDSISNAEVRIAHAYQALVKEYKAKKISQQGFVKEVATLTAKLPKRVRTHWMRSLSAQKSHHVSYAKYLGNTVAPLVASLDVAFNPREIVHAMGHNFEPDYLLKTLDGQTLWGEYLGMSAAGSSSGAHYNIRSEFKKMGYGNKGVFFYPTHLPRFPSPSLLEVLHTANVIGFDAAEKEYYVMISGRKDFIRTHSSASSANPAQA